MSDFRGLRNLFEENFSSFANLQTFGTPELIELFLSGCLNWSWTLPCVCLSWQACFHLILNYRNGFHLVYLSFLDSDLTIRLFSLFTENVSFRSVSKCVSLQFILTWANDIRPSIITRRTK